MAANGPPKRRPSLNAATSANSPPVRLTTSQRCGAAPPKNPKTAVNTTGNGFQDGPPASPSESLVEASSWPQSIHAQGSELGTHESTNTLKMASTRHTPTASAI